MSIEIKTSTLQPIRNTYGHIERRFGDKPATRYQEASYDIQQTNNFHYRPLWQPSQTLNDKGLTKIEMEDWYVFRDPRQYYYGTYVQARNKMQEVAENSYAYFEKRELGLKLPEEVKEKVIKCLIPLRHLELGANINNMYGTAYGYGTTLTQGFLYCAMDRLGIAQYLSRIGLMLDGNAGEALATGKNAWLYEPMWQGIRRYVEDVMATKDWFEMFIAQDVVLDALIYQLMYHQFDNKVCDMGGSDLAMLLEFMQVWYKDHTRWVDAVLKTAAAESEQNKVLLEQWLEGWLECGEQAMAPLAEEALGVGALAEAKMHLLKRLNKVGLMK